MRTTRHADCLRPVRAVDAVTVEIVRLVEAVAVKLGYPLMVVGATARIILLENVLGLSAGRATRDVDFAFALENWAQFDALKRQLVTEHAFEMDAKVPHRLYFCAPQTHHAIPVDVVPFGALSGVSEEIYWPPEQVIKMNVAGFADALAAAVRVELAPGLTVALTSLPGMALLKLFAWADRGRENHKDALDLAQLLRRYHETDNERVYTIPAAAFERAGYDIELAGAWMLGNDAAALASRQTNTKIAAILSDTRLCERLVVEMARALDGHAAAEAQSTRLLTHFSDGFGDQGLR